MLLRPLYLYMLVLMSASLNLLASYIEVIWKKTGKLYPEVNFFFFFFN